MRRLVGDLLLLARADARRTLSRGPTDLADVLLEAASELGPMAEDHELSIDARPAVVPGVRDDLHRLTLNLIENAARHTPPGTHIRAATAVENGVAVLTVEDDGPGIPARARGARVRPVRPRRGTGTRGSGLGLAIVRAVAESHGGVGRARAAGDSVTGTRFVIKIPRDPTAGNGQPARDAGRHSRRRAQPAPTRSLTLATAHHPRTPRAVGRSCTRRASREGSADGPRARSSWTSARR